MSSLDQVACPKHQGKGFHSDCYECEIAVMLLQINLIARSRPTSITQLLLVAPPTTARKLFYALGKAVAGAELAPAERELLQTLKDMAQDCVEKLRT